MDMSLDVDRKIKGLTYGSSAEAVDPVWLLLLEVVDHHDHPGDAERHEEERVESRLDEAEVRARAREQKDLRDDNDEEIMWLPRGGRSENKVK